VGTVTAKLPSNPRNVVNPRDRTVDVYPASPNIASGIAKRAA
jgi:hypothetical protein